MARKPNSPPFKKGDDPRRNVTGANRGSKWLTTKLDEALRRIGDGNKEPYDDLLIKRVMRNAIVDGDMRAIEHIWNRLEGTAPQTIDLQSKGESIASGIDKEHIRLITKQVVTSLLDEQLNAPNG